MDTQGFHLLTTEFFGAMHRVLVPGGKITIVTDNEWYFCYYCYCFPLDMININNIVIILLLLLSIIMISLTISLTIY